MAERRLAERPAMQLVGLDEDANDTSSPVRSAPERLHEAATGARTFASRRPGTAGAVVLAVVGLLATVVLVGPGWLSARERAEVLGPAAFVGAVDSLRAAPQVRWTAQVDGSAAPLLVGDVVVVTTGSVEDRDRQIVGLDAITGAGRWAIPLGAAPVPDSVTCKSVGDLLACVSGPTPTPDRRDLAQVPDSDVGVGTLWAIDPTDGTVRAHHPVAGWVMATAAAGSDLVVASYVFGRLTIRRIELLTGRKVWETERFVTARSSTNGRIRLVVGGGLVMANGNDSTLLLDAATGERQARSTEALGVDETRLVADGTLVREQYRILGSAIVARSSLSTGEGDPWLTAEGSVLSVDVSDGSSGFTFTSDGLGVDGVRAYRPGFDQQAWQTPTQATRVSVDAAGRVVVRNGGTLAGLDAADGAVVWVRDLGAVSGPAVSDGRRIGVVRGGLDDRPVLVAVDLAEGTIEWELPLPPSTTRVVQLGTQLYAVGDDALVALR